MSAKSKINTLSADEIRQRKFLKRGLQLSVLVLGATGTGKSTFINCLCDEDILTTNRPAPADLTIENHTAKIYEGGTQINLDVVMAPGYGDFIDNRNSTKTITDYIETQFESVLTEECRVQRNPNFKDTRIHAAVYFIRPTGKGLRELDIQCLKELSIRCNVIPVISKADLLTEEEIELNKRLIIRDITRERIEVFDFSSCVADIEEVEEDAESTAGSIQDLVPFAIISGTDRKIIDQIEYKVRKLPHGVVRVDDPSHSDFSVLRTCLLGASLHDLKESTHSHYYEKYRTQKLLKPTLSDSKPVSKNGSLIGKPTSSGSLLDRLRNTTLNSRSSSFMSTDKYAIHEGMVS